MKTWIRDALAWLGETALRAFVVGICAALAVVAVLWAIRGGGGEPAPYVPPDPPTVTVPAFPAVTAVTTPVTAAPVPPSTTSAPTAAEALRTAPGGSDGYVAPDLVPVVASIHAAITSIHQAGSETTDCQQIDSALCERISGDLIAAGGHLNDALTVLGDGTDLLGAAGFHWPGCNSQPFCWPPAPDAEEPHAPCAQECRDCDSASTEQIDECLRRCADKGHPGCTPCTTARDDCDTIDAACSEAEVGSVGETCGEKWGWPLCKAVCPHGC